MPKETAHNPVRKITSYFCGMLIPPEGVITMKRFPFLAGLLAVMMLCSPLNAAAIGYGQGKARDAQNRPEGAVQFQEEYGRYEAYALSGDGQRIILTFDQGYENGYTAKILDTLKEKGVSAIFFLTGDYAKREPELVRRMLAEGHTLGNHGMRHAALPSLNEAETEDEIMSLHRLVQNDYGCEMQYFRPPCGEYTPEALAKIHSLGYKTVFWSAAYVDWKTDDQPAPAEALSLLTDAAHGGAVYLLHSVSATNAEILGDLIDALRAKGFTL